MNDNNHYHFKIDLDAHNGKKNLGDELDNILIEHDIKKGVQIIDSNHLVWSVQINLVAREPNTA